MDPDPVPVPIRAAAGNKSAAAAPKQLLYFRGRRILAAALGLLSGSLLLDAAWVVEAARTPLGAAAVDALHGDGAATSALPLGQPAVLLQPRGGRASRDLGPLLAR